MTKGALKNLMFTRVNEKKKYEGNEKLKGKPVSQPPKPPTVSETEGFRILSELFKTKDAKAIVKLGPAADVIGMSPLALASSVGHKEAVICLIKAKVCLNRQSPDGNYPLIQAVRGKFVDIVELLLKKGATVSLTNYEGDNAFMIAVVTGDAKIINTIWAHRGNLDINHANKYGTTALHLATERKWEGCVEFLLLNGADANYRNANGCTPLFVAVVKGDMKLIEKLVAKTDILIEDNGGFSAICRGVEAEKDDIVKFLVTKLTNAQKDSYAKSRLEKLRMCALDEVDYDRENSDSFFEVLFTIFKLETFKDTLYRVKAIPNVLQFSRQYVDIADVMSTMFVLCTMLMTDFGTIVDERFTMQFIRAQGQDLVMKTLKQNPYVDQIEKSQQDTEPGLVAGILLPLICLCGLDEGREWLKKNMDNVQLIRVTEHLRSGSTIENFFNCQRCPPRFKKVWQSYLEFFDNQMLARRVTNQADLLLDEERDKQKALKRRERKRLKRQKQKVAKEENVNKNANGKANPDMEISRAVGAEMSRRSEDSVRYDQHVLMPDWNVCIENVRTNDGNIIQTKRDPMQFRYNYVEPTHNKRTNGYHMPQAVTPVKNKSSGQNEWQKVENKRTTAKTAATKQLQVNQNAADPKKPQKRRQNKTREPNQQVLPRQTSRVVGHVCWADVAKGTARPQQMQHEMQQHQHIQQQQQQHQQRFNPFQHGLQGETIHQFQQEHQEPNHLQKRQEVSSPRQEVFAYEEDFPILREDVDKVSVGDTDASEVQSTSTTSLCGEHLIDQIPDPVTESDIMGNVPMQHMPPDNGCNFGYPNPYSHLQQQQPQFIPHYQMIGQIPIASQNLVCNYGLNSQNPPPGFQAHMMQPQIRQRMPQLPQQPLQYGLRVSYPQGPAFPAPTVTMANIAQSLLQPYCLDPTTHGEANPPSLPDQLVHSNNWEMSPENHANTEENCVTEPSNLQEQAQGESIWSSRQQSQCLTDTPHIEAESGWNTCSNEEFASHSIHDEANDDERNELTFKCATDGEDKNAQVFNNEHVAQQGMNEDDFSKILTSLARCLAVSKSESVLFPETLREVDDTITASNRTSTIVPENQTVFPAFHDMESTVNETLNPFLLENIAKEQVKRQYRTIAGKPVLENSAYFHDFDYYASLYGLTTEELKASAAEYAQVHSIPSQEIADVVNAGQGDGFAAPQEDTTIHTADVADVQVQEQEEISQPVDASNISCLTPEKQKTVPIEPDVKWVPQSRRWKDKLAEIIDLSYTLRKQLGRIVIPVNTAEYKMNKSGDPVVLGFLTDGCEVAVQELDSDREVVDKDLVKKLAASDTKYNFLLRYKALAEMDNKHYLAMELCDYTLEEYVTITRLDHHHDPLATNRLAWQLLKGIRYLHEDIGIVHGSLRPDNVYVDGEGKLRVGGYGIIQMDKYGQFSKRPAGNCCWRATEMFAEDETSTATTSSDVQVVGMLLYYILTGGRHPYGSSTFEIELNLCQNSTKLAFISEEANDLISSMLFSDVEERPSIDTCLRHPFFWSEEKRFRMVLISGSDILKEMKTGVALTGSGSTTMTDFLNVSEYQTISDGWINLIDGAVLKEMRAFRQYKNTLAEMVLFIYNCCLHFDKMSFAAREVLDDPCRYFLLRFPPLFMAVYRAIKASDRTDRSCYRPFF